MHSKSYNLIFFIALLASALALGAALAHALELPNKMTLTRAEYLIAQKSYRGWDLLGVLLLVQLAAIVTTAILSRREPRVMYPVILAGVFLLCAQAVFWAFTYPANVTTQNWTTLPENWTELRSRWEYSHAVGALFQVLTASSLFIAALTRRAR
jgi:hypothetical protein